MAVSQAVGSWQATQCATLTHSPVILRPSIVFGPEDGFFNKFADMARYSPALPLIGGGTMKFQPVYVGDVAEAFARAVDGEIEGGKIYELGGPEVLTFRECLEEILEITERKRILLNTPWWLARIQRLYGTDGQYAVQGPAFVGMGWRWYL